MFSREGTKLLEAYSWSTVWEALEKGPLRCHFQNNEALGVILKKRKCSICVPEWGVGGGERTKKKSMMFSKRDEMRGKGKQEWLMLLCDKRLIFTHSCKGAQRHSSRPENPNNPVWDTGPPTQLLPGLSPASAPWASVGMPGTRSQWHPGSLCRLRGVAACQNIGLTLGYREEHFGIIQDLQAV